MTWEEQTRQRTGRVSTQGPDQIILYCTRRSFMLMQSCSFGKHDDGVRYHRCSFTDRSESNGNADGGKRLFPYEEGRPNVNAAVILDPKCLFC